MLIKNLVNWSGPRFEYEPGDIVELDDKIAQARIEAGVAEKYTGRAEKPEVKQHAE